MDQNEFKTKINQVGDFKRKWGGRSPETGEWEELVFVTKDIIRVCTDCDRAVTNRQLVYELKHGYKDRPYWRTKCKTCKETWNELRL